MEQVIEEAKNRKPKIIAVAVAQDLEVLCAVKKAKEEHVSEAILVGDKVKIEEIAKENNISVSDFRIIDIKDLSEASEKAVELVSTGEAYSYEGIS
jgi:phosphate butyryltransferase